MARLVSPRRPDVVRRILEAFRGGATVTKEELLRHSGVSEKMLEYFLAEMNRWYMLTSKRAREGKVYYTLNPEAFHARIDTLLVDPLRNLVS